MKLRIKESAERPYAKVQVGMQWVDNEFTKECVKISGNKCWIKESWLSMDSDGEHKNTTVYNIVMGDNCDVLVNPKYPDEWYGKIYVNSSINLDEFYPDYWDGILREAWQFAGLSKPQVVNFVHYDDFDAFMKALRRKRLDDPECTFDEDSVVWKRFEDNKAYGLIDDDDPNWGRVFFTAPNATRDAMQLKVYRNSIPGAVHEVPYYIRRKNGY